MFPFILPIAIGAAGGALMNKKNPLNGALLGGALGGLGGAGMGAMGFGGEGLSAATLEAQQAAAAEGVLSPELVGTQAGGYGPMGAEVVERSVPINSVGSQGMKQGAGKAGGLLETAGRAANSASTIKGLMGPEQTQMIQASPYTTGSINPPANAYQGIQQQRMAQNQANDALRSKRRRNIGLIG